MTTEAEAVALVEDLIPGVTIEQVVENGSDRGPAFTVYHDEGVTVIAPERPDRDPEPTGNI